MISISTQKMKIGAAIRFFLSLSALGCICTMAIYMYKYARELEQERSFILKSREQVSSAFRSFESMAKIAPASNIEESRSPAIFKGSNHVENTKFNGNIATSISKLEPQLDSVGRESSVDSWTSRFLVPVLCGSVHHRNIFHLHMRKAAGTTIRNFLNDVVSSSKTKYFESEGISIAHGFNALDGVTFVVSLREPIARIYSMYWYEHVAWYNEIKKDMSKCSNFKTWVQAWRDGSEWKTNFILKNPGNTYVEIENYYVKTLSGWKGPEKANELDLSKAKAALEQYDVIILAELLKNESQTNFLT